MMTDREKYRRAFSQVRPGGDFADKLRETKCRAQKCRRYRCTAAIAALALIAVGTTTAYAADAFGLRQTIRLWLGGVRTEAAAEFDRNGGYRLEYTDADGELQIQYGGGERENKDGIRCPLTEEELVQQLTAPETEIREDGTVWVYWKDQSAEITDRFKNGYACVEMTQDGQTVYLTVNEDGSYVLSRERFLLPENWRVLP